MKIVSDETRRKMSEAAKRRCTPEWRKMRSEQQSTQLPFDEVRRLYEGGRTQAEIAALLETTQKVVWKFMKSHGLTARIAKKRDQQGDKNDYWGGKGNGSVTYSAYHYRVQAMRGTEKRCETCGTTDPSKSYDWANLTGNYADPNDYRRLCRSCHWILDGKILNIKRMRKSSQSVISSRE